MNEDLQQTVETGKILRRISRHLSLLSHRIEALESLSGDLSSKTGPLPPKVISGLQDIDFLRQAMDDLSVLTGHLAQATGDSTISADEATDLADRLALSATRMLMDVSPFADLLRAEPAPPAGEAQLF